MVAMDDLDRAVLAELTADARRTYATIGAVVGLSAPAVKRRVDRLRADGMIRGFTVVLDPRALGRDVEAYVELHTTGVIGVERMRAALGEVGEVVEAVTVTGRADTVIRLAAGDVDQLEAAVRRLRAIAGVRYTETNLIMTRLI